MSAAGGIFSVGSIPGFAICGLVLCADWAIFLYLIASSRRRSHRATATINAEPVSFHETYEPPRGESIGNLLISVSSILVASSPIFLVGGPSDPLCAVGQLPIVVGTLTLQLGLYLRVRVALRRRTFVPNSMPTDGEDYFEEEIRRAAGADTESKGALLTPAVVLPTLVYLALFAAVVVDFPAPKKVWTTERWASMSSQGDGEADIWLACESVYGVGPRALALSYFAQGVSICALLLYLAILYARCSQREVSLEPLETGAGALGVVSTWSDLAVETSSLSARAPGRPLLQEVLTPSLPMLAPVLSRSFSQQLEREGALDPSDGLWARECVALMLSGLGGLLTVICFGMLALVNVEVGRLQPLLALYVTLGATVPSSVLGACGVLLARRVAVYAHREMTGRVAQHHRNAVELDEMEDVYVSHQ